MSILYKTKSLKSYICDHFPIGCRGCSRDFVEQPCEIGRVAEREPVGDLFDTQVGGGQQRLGQFHFAVVDVLQRRLPALALEQTDEVIFGQTAHFGDRVDRDVFL